MMKRLPILVLITVLSAVSLHAADIVVLEPSECPPAYRHAATEFCKFYKAVTGNEARLTAQAEPGCDLVVIGSDIVNPYVRKAIEDRVISPLNLGAGSDSYRIVSAKEGGRNVLFLAGGCGRSTLYAVYDFFERQAGCHYFWDGDIIPHMDSIPIEGLDIAQAPRFQYRGLRYFAHRSLPRFQAEHWSAEEWDREIDWLLKKRLNLFMLRIGMDDVFQKAFPDIVPYPPTDDYAPEAIKREYNDRTTAWPLEYRGELRKHILQYAAERELFHPEDMGTMTHWYSPTPKAFVEKVQPEFFNQTGGCYQGNPCTAVWDIRKDENLDNYWKLTQAHIDNYGSPHMFHTIGLAERNFYDNRQDNMELKRYTYRRLIGKLREKYPDAPLIIAGWDFYIPGWQPDETKALLDQLDPRNTIIMDYMSDMPTDGSNADYRRWGVVGKFPYFFGILHAYEWENELRNRYDRIRERIPEALDDPMCKGFVLWPENSHTDQLVLQFLTHNAWSPDMLAPEDLVRELCSQRYGANAAVMERAWLAALPMMALCEDLGPVFRDIAGLEAFGLSDGEYGKYQEDLEKLSAAVPDMDALFAALSSVPFGTGDLFVDRDAVDLVRTVAGRLYAAEMYRYMIVQKDWENGKCRATDVRKAGERAGRMLALISQTLSLSDDYSLNVTMKHDRAVHEVNPVFEQTLKGNCENGYCRTYVSELFDYYFIPEFVRYQSYVNAGLKGKPVSGQSYSDIVDAFYDKPLAEMKYLNAAQRTPEGYGKLLSSISSLY